MTGKTRIAFLSQLINAPVYSEAGRQSGTVVDFNLSLRDNWPTIDKVVIYDFNTSNNRVADKICFSTFSLEKFVLATPINDLPVSGIENISTSAIQLLDKSVIDTVNVRTVSVNDLAIACDNTGAIRVMGIDISFAGAMRRLRLNRFLQPIFKRLGYKSEPDILSWDKIIGFNEQFTKLTPELTTDNFQNLHPADLADILDDLEDSERISVIENMDEEVAAETIAEADSETQLQIFEQLDTETASEIIEEMDPDEAADLLQEMDQTRAREILSHMDHDEASDVRRLLEHDEDTAGGIMTTEYAAIYEDFTVENAFTHLRLIAADIEMIYYMYVLDSEERLKGVVSIRDMLSANPAVLVSKIMDNDIVAVTPDTPQEEVANLISKYDYMAIPVVTDDRKIIGVVTVDDIMDVMEEEATEDIFKFAGSTDEELTYNSPFQACRARLPWLLITLGTGFITSIILKFFMNEFKEVMVLVFFVPVVMAMGGNTGIQSSTLVIRSLALDSFTASDLLKRLGREVATGALMGIACGMVVGLWAEHLITSGGQATQYSSIFLAATVGLAMLCAMTFAAMFGAFVPILFDKFKIDPAVASGPFVTSSNDIFALLIYYGVSVALLSMA